MSPCYPEINRDLLLTGAFLHNLGKIDELRYERDLSYSDEGQLIGHLVMAVGMLERKIAEAEKLSGEPIPEETVLRLKHMIVSHHGEYAYGSPKLPMTLEAVALYCLDNLDAKVNAFGQLLRDDPNVDSTWTAFSPTSSGNCSRAEGGGRKGEGREEGGGRRAEGGRMKTRGLLWPSTRLRTQFWNSLGGRTTGR